MKKKSQVTKRKEDIISKQDSFGIEGLIEGLTKKIKIIDRSLGTTLKRLQDETQKFE